MRGRIDVNKGIVSLGGIRDYEQKIMNANRIIIVKQNGSQTNTLNKKNIKQLNKKLQAYGVDIFSLYEDISFTEKEQSWPDDTRILTDQFSPVNLLNTQ